MEVVDFLRSKFNDQHFRFGLLRKVEKNITYRNNGLGSGYTANTNATHPKLANILSELQSFHCCVTVQLNK